MEGVEPRPCQEAEFINYLLPMLLGKGNGRGVSGGVEEEGEEGIRFGVGHGVQEGEKVRSGG